MQSSSTEIRELGNLALDIINNLAFLQPEFIPLVWTATSIARYFLNKQEEQEWARPSDVDFESILKDCMNKEQSDKLKSVVDAINIELHASAKTLNVQLEQQDNYETVIQFIESSFSKKIKQLQKQYFQYFRNEIIHILDSKMFKNSEKGYSNAEEVERTKLILQTVFSLIQLHYLIACFECSNEFYLKINDKKDFTDTKLVDTYCSLFVGGDAYMNRFAKAYNCFQAKRLKMIKISLNSKRDFLITHSSPLEKPIPDDPNLSIAKAVGWEYTPGWFGGSESLVRWYIADKKHYENHKVEYEKKYRGFYSDVQYYYPTWSESNSKSPVNSQLHKLIRTSWPASSFTDDYYGEEHLFMSDFEQKKGSSPYEIIWHHQTAKCETLAAEYIKKVNSELFELKEHYGNEIAKIKSSFEILHYSYGIYHEKYKKNPSALILNKEVLKKQISKSLKGFDNAMDSNINPQSLPNTLLDKTQQLTI